MQATYLLTCLLPPPPPSGVFVLILAAIPVFSVADNDRITLTKIIVVLVSGGGAVLVGVSQVSGNEITNGGGFLGLAICYSTVGAFLYVHTSHTSHTYIYYFTDSYCFISCLSSWIGVLFCTHLCILV